MCRHFFLAMIMLGSVLLLTNQSVYAENDTDMELEIYSEQLKASGADKLNESLPRDAEDRLRLIGVNGVDWREVLSLTPSKFFSAILLMFKDKMPVPLKSAVYIIGIILITAMASGFKQDRHLPLSQTIDVVSTLSVCAVTLGPVVKFIVSATSIIDTASKFILCYIPVITGVMAASGQSLSAVSYNVMMLTTCEVISQISSNVLTPLLCILLQISIISAISPRLNLLGVCEFFNLIIKWLLGFVMTVFVGLLTIQSLVGNTADSAAGKAVKFMMSSFVPVVGNVIGDALSTVSGCMRLLKSGVSAFGMLGAGFVFLPIIVQSCIWVLAFNACAAVSNMFELFKITFLLKNIARVMGILLSIVICCMMILVVSTAIVLIVGSNTV